jgi:hypothetical protein
MTNDKGRVRGYRMPALSAWQVLPETFGCGRFCIDFQHSALTNCFARAGAHMTEQSILLSTDFHILDQIAHLVNPGKLEAGL